MSNTIFDLQMQDTASGSTIIASGGACYVALAGTARKASLLNPDAGYATLANPISINRGKIKFAISNANGATPGSTSVDVYGVGPNGRAFVLRGAQGGAPSEVYVSGNGRRETLIVPFSALDGTANTEIDTGFDLPVGALILTEGVCVNVRTAEASRTMSVGLLSSQSGGNATGIIVGASLAAAGVVKPTMAGTPTIGALLRATVASNPVPEGALIGAATRITYTLSASSASADGFIVVPYQLTN